MFEELMIQIRSSLDGGGFTAAENAISRLRNSTTGMASTAASSFNAMGNSTSAATTKLNQSGTAGKAAGSSISAAMSNATNAVSGLGGAVTSVIAGFGLMEIGNMMWTGATERQFNNAYLSMKLGSEQAAVMSEEIEKIVAAVPGDDTFMNNLLGTAAARGAAIEDLKTLGYVAANYMIAAKKTEMNSIEAQQDLNSYIMTGTTAELERSRVLVGQVDKLKGKESIHERILALDEALKANGYEGLSQMDIMKIKWETLKGKIQLAATEIGMKFLPYLERGVEILLELDEKTGGWSSTLIIIAGVVLGIGMALGGVAMFLGPLVPLVGSLAGAFGLVETAELGAAAAGYAVLTPLLAIAALGVIAVTIMVIDDWSRSRFEDPNYINKLREGGQITTPENADTVGRTRGFMIGPGQPILNQPGFGVGFDVASQNYEGVGQALSGLNLGNVFAGKIKEFKWPNITLQNVIDVIKNAVPGLKWSIPTSSDLVNRISQYIEQLNWRIPSSADLVMMIRDFIAWLGWDIPTSPDLVAMISNFIGFLHWDIPSAGQILDAIVNRMTGRGAAGDAQSMAENASLTPINFTPSGNYAGSGDYRVYKFSPVIHIGSINSEDDAEHYAKKTAEYLAKLNDVKGR